MCHLNSHNMSSTRNHSITSAYILIFINQITALNWNHSSLISAPFYSPEAYPIVDLSWFCRTHKLWLKRVVKHSGLLVWESGDLIYCHYLTGPASRHLLLNAVSGNTEKIGITWVGEEETHPCPFMLIGTSLGPKRSSQQWGTGLVADSFITGRHQNPPIFVPSHC